MNTSTSIWNEDLGADESLFLSQDEVQKAFLEDLTRDIASSFDLIALSGDAEKRRSLASEILESNSSKFFDAQPQSLHNEDCEALVDIIDKVLEEMQQEAGQEATPTTLAPGSGPLAGLPMHRQIFDLLILKTAQLPCGKDKEKVYEDFIARHDPDTLFRLLEVSTDQAVWKDCVEGHRATDRSYFADWQEDFVYFRRGWYVVYLWDELAPDWWKIYVGQAETLFDRANQHHARSRNTNSNSFLYWTWRGDGETASFSLRKGKIMKLGLDESGFEGDDARLFLNLGEMWFSLIFQSLQKHDLKDWLPEGCAKPDQSRGLNVALPLHQGYSSSSYRGFGKLFRSEDPAVLAYARRLAQPIWESNKEYMRNYWKDPSNRARRDANRAARRAAGTTLRGDPKLYAKSTKTLRETGSRAEFLRDPDLSRGEPRSTYFDINLSPPGLALEIVALHVLPRQKSLWKTKIILYATRSRISSHHVRRFTAWKFPGKVWLKVCGPPDLLWLGAAKGLTDSLIRSQAMNLAPCRVDPTNLRQIKSGVGKTYLLGILFCNATAVQEVQEPTFRGSH
ncbi:uncharacterized protein E0L32_011075 [Thyridium curvatum]|uniref:Uncharacterized protein n=1 Tax=Thyridium curvatum TaxID=1093900 RepID=A0A507AJJ2_9PEZI|nr:uncharacterized protein E0L32_011075 [Thyridium curvatum]TPX07007.1 hypothetical protein E0L32_011075 [Thyridium curvatum]